MRSFPIDPFSIRETGIYHSFHTDTNESSWVFIQASNALEEQLKHCFSQPKETKTISQFRIHGMILQTALDGWRDYLVYLEETFSNLVSAYLPLYIFDVYGVQRITAFQLDIGFFLNKSVLQEGCEIDYPQLRKLQLLIDKGRRLLQILNLNITVAEQMKCSIQRIKRHSSSSLSFDFDGLASTIEMFIFQHRTNTSRLQSMIDRAKGVHHLVSGFIA